MQLDFQELASDIKGFKVDIVMVKEEVQGVQENILDEIDGVKGVIVDLQNRLSKYVHAILTQCESMTFTHFYR